MKITSKIIAILISVVTRNEVKVVRIIFLQLLSNDILRSKWIAATRQDEGPDFEVSKSRIVTSALLAARVISDRFCLSIADSANNLFDFFFRTKN